MLASLSDNTYKQYGPCIKAYINYCNDHSHDYIKISIPVIINFLTYIFDNGAKYGSINNYKSAISLLLGTTLDDNRIKRFMKGVYKLRPTLPKYNLTWNPGTVLNYLAKQWPNESLNLETISKKTLTLLALCCAHRVQTFSLIKSCNITITESEIIIKIPDLIKTSRPTSLQPILRLPYFNERPEICPARCLETYLNKTQTLRNPENSFLFISHKKPHYKVTSQTLSSWIKIILHKSGVDTSVFTAHSTRHSATSTANKLGVSLDVIRKTAGWTDSSCVFAKYYNKEIIPDCNQFARSILSSVDNL